VTESGEASVALTRCSAWHVAYVYRWSLSHPHRFHFWPKPADLLHLQILSYSQKPKNLLRSASSYCFFSAFALLRISSSLKCACSHAAAAACASSRPSCRGNSPSTSRRHFRPRSGSTPHDEISQPSPKSRLSARSSADHGSARSHAAFTTQPPHRSSPLHRPEHPKKASPPTSFPILMAQPTLAAELSCGPPTAKSP
jgi:hypothetical protein